MNLPRIRHALTALAGGAALALWLGAAPLPAAAQAGAAPAPARAGASAAAAPVAPAAPGSSAAAGAAAAQAEPAVSGPGQRIYDRSRQRLLQVRTLLATQDSQSSVGSGFLVDDPGSGPGGTLLVTNYHVVSQFAAQPGRYRLVYVTVDGQEGPLQLLAFDVVHDLALLRPVQPGALAGRGSVALRAADDPLPRGARIYALGNPLDVGFAVAEGSYNGLVERSFLPTLFFGGSLSAGMSGGPALDEQGRLVGVNVATRRDGEQVSFLVPADAVRALVARGRTASPVTSPAWPEIARQLLAHQDELTQRFAALPWRGAGHPRWAIPVPQESFMRCWGSGSGQATRGLQFERSDCTMDSRVYVSGSLLTGFLTVRHEAYDGAKLGTLRFQHRYSESFGNEFMGVDDRHRTAPRCLERSVDRAGLPLRAVVCLRAYKKLPGLHDLHVLVATLDGSRAGAQGRFDGYGLSLANAQRLAAHYLDGFAWTAAPTPPASAPRPAASASR